MLSQPNSNKARDFKENIDIPVELKEACEKNDIERLHQLIETNSYIDINQPLQRHGMTLLGIAAFHGHVETIKYLIEVRLADVNVKDTSGNTALHQVVYGDSHPFNHHSYGISHDKVAKYLIRNGGDLSLKNNKEETPYDNTKWCAPLKLEDMIGRRFITNTGSDIYYADKVRPVFEKELEDRKICHRIVIGERKPKEYDEFCLENAIKRYVKNGTVSYGYTSQEQIITTLSHQTGLKKEHFKYFVDAQSPAPYSFKYGIISNQLSKIAKQSAAAGVTTFIATYYGSNSVLLSVTTGSMSAYLAWLYLSETALEAKLDQRKGQEGRVSLLLNNNGIFNRSREINLKLLSKESTVGEDHTSFVPSMN